MKGLKIKYNGEYQEAILGPEIQKRTTFLLIIQDLHGVHESFYTSYLLIEDLW